MIEQADIKLAMDMLTEMNDDATCDHVIGILERCGNEIASLRQQLTSAKSWEEAVVCACMRVEGCLSKDPNQTMKALEDYWFSAGMDEQQTVSETALILDLRQQLAEAKVDAELFKVLAKEAERDYIEVAKNEPPYWERIECEEHLREWANAMKESKDADA